MRLPFLLLSLPLFGESPPSHGGLFFELGGSYNVVTLDQELQGSTFSTLFSGPSLVALGESGGAAPPLHTTQSTLAPQVEIGYLSSPNPWFVGGKGLYQYLGLTFEQNSLTPFPRGLYTAVTGGESAFTSYLSIDSLQTRVLHELSLLPLFGYSFSQSRLSFGAGGIAFWTEETLYGIKGVTQLNASPSEIVGASPSLSSSKWILGGVAELGWSYLLSESSTLSISYSYALTEQLSSQESLLFSHSLITTSTYTEEGVAQIKNERRLTVQSLMFRFGSLF